MSKINQILVKKLGEEKAEKVIKKLYVARVIKNVVCWILIAVLAFAVITFLLARVNGSTPSVFGYSFQRVETASMVPALEVGDVLVSKNVSDQSDIQVGDIITFRGDSRFENHRVTHRVFTAPYTNEQGELVLVTKGDANEVTDGEIKVSDVESKMLHKAGFMKWLFDFFFSPFGLIVFIFLMLLVFFDEILNIIHITSGKYDENEQEESIGEIIKRIQQEDKEKEEQMMTAGDDENETK